MSTDIEKNSGMKFDKQLIHIAGEVVVILIVVYYFSGKNQKLQSNIEDLSQKLEEKEELIKKLETSIIQTNQKLDNVIAYLNSSQSQVKSQSQSQTKQPLPTTKPIVTEQKKSEKKVEFVNPPKEDVISDVEDDEADFDIDALDNEIKDEIDKIKSQG